MTPLAAYLEDCRRRGLSKATMWSRSHSLEKFDREVGLMTATTEQIATWLDRNIAMSSKGTYIGTLRAFYEWALDNEHLEVNPTRKLSKLRVPKGEPHPIDAAELTRAISGANPEMKVWLLLAAAGGLRCVEIANLNVEDIHLEEPQWLHIGSGKGSKTRNIPLHPDIAQALKVLVWPSQGRLFPDLTPQSLSQRGSRYLKSVGSVSTMHKLRHYAATTYWAALNDAGTPDVLLLTDFLGHSSPSTSLIYTRRDQSKGMEAMKHFRVGS